MSEPIRCKCGNDRYLTMKMAEGSDMLNRWFEGRPMMVCNQCGMTHKLHYRLDGISLHEVAGLTRLEEGTMTLRDLITG